MRQNATESDRIGHIGIYTHGLTALHTVTQAKKTSDSKAFETKKSIWPGFGQRN